tara:strand:+ start:275 stop:616 length:342 start_codon:yes stop_codon:yes gene_type:complete
MELTGKCKEEFEEWLVCGNGSINFEKYYNDRHGSDNPYTWFTDLPQSMQYGVYIDFFDKIKYEGKGFFSVVFERYYNDKTDDFNHNDIVSNSIEQCNKFYNEMLIEIDYKLNK